MPAKKTKVKRKPSNAAARRSLAQKRIEVRTRRKDESATIQVGRQTLAVIEGTEDLSDWTDDELIAGFKAGGRNGQGKLPPKIVPIRVHQELVSRVTQTAKHRFAAELHYAVDKHMQIIKLIDPSDPTPTQLKAIEMLYERILGKPTEHVALYNGGEIPAWQKAVAAGIVGSDQEAEEQIIDGEIVEED